MYCHPAIHFLHYASVALSNASITFYLPLRVEAMYGRVLSKSECEVICAIKSSSTPSLRAVTTNVLRAVCEVNSVFGVLTSSTLSNLY